MGTREWRRETIALAIVLGVGAIGFVAIVPPLLKDACGGLGFHCEVDGARRVVAVNGKGCPTPEWVVLTSGSSGPLARQPCGWIVGPDGATLADPAHPEEPWFKANFWSGHP